MDTEKLEELRKPFPEGTVGKLPKVTCPDCSKKSCQRHQKSKCQECGAYISSAHVHLDFVGHAAVTDRLLSVDPTWTWEPLALDERGLPALDQDGNLWIRLTVLGVTRLGVGDGPNMKERIGDALRNAAMRFGVALSLWTKDELESGYLESKPDEPVQAPEPAKPSRAATHGTVRRAPTAAPVDAQTGEIAPSLEAASQKQLGMIAALFGDKGFMDDRAIRHAYVKEIIGREFESTKELSKKEASRVIESLMAEPVQSA